MRIIVKYSLVIKIVCTANHVLRFCEKQMCMIIFELSH